MAEFPSKNWTDYEPLDSGNGEKLERFSGYILSRPEPKALWDKSLPQKEWDRLSHTRFKPGAGFGKAGKEDSGTWERLKKTADQWYIRYNGEQEGPARYELSRSDDEVDCGRVRSERSERSSSGCSTRASDASAADARSQPCRF